MKIEILEKIDWGRLKDYILGNMIVANKHPLYDIWILNYSPKTVSKRFWDTYTLSCRGLVVDIDGNILARPFQKFKNFEEHDASEIDMSQPYEIFEKMDGSFIIIFYYEEKGEWIVASRGSFISEQSIEAKKIFGDKYHLLLKENTYLFEVIYPENRIVVNYGELCDIVMLGVINTKSGNEMSYVDMFSEYFNNFSIVKKWDYDIRNLNELKVLDEDNMEGFVIKFKNGFRVKVKFSEYIRLHGILTNVSNITVWEHMMNNYEFDELLDRVPDEFYDWLISTSNVLQNEFNLHENNALKEFLNVYYINGVTDRKKFAENVKKSSYCSVLFRLYDKRPYSNIIWKIIRPTYSKPFKDGYVNKL